MNRVKEFFIISSLYVTKGIDDDESMSKNNIHDIRLKSFGIFF